MDATNPDTAGHLVGTIRLRVQHFAKRNDLTVYGVVDNGIPTAGAERTADNTDLVNVIARIERRHAQQVLDDLWSVGLRPSSANTPTEGTIYLQPLETPRRHRMPSADLGDNFPVFHDVGSLELPDDV